MPEIQLPGPQMIMQQQIMEAEDKEYKKQTVKSYLFSKNYYSDEIKENEIGSGHVAWMADTNISHWSE
jgi:hypothetical protein